MRSILFATLLMSAACSIPASADQMAATDRPAVAMTGPRTALAIAPDKVRAPYDVQVVRENGETLPTFAKTNRFYVQGNAGERYIIRVTNPTAKRIEAVVSVDGLDVVDGQPGDMNKRGYIVPPYGETRIEGFRTSTEDVATFRFSSVDDSYAGKQGKARNVGVIAVALFEEQAVPEQQIVVGAVEKDKNEGFRAPSDYDYGDDMASRDSAPSRAPSPVKSGEAKRSIAPSESRPAPAPPTTTASKPAPPRGGSSGAGAPRARMLDESAADVREYQPPSEEAPKTDRPGLGTEFGEQRFSSVSYTQFVRAPGAPIAIAELRYNDTEGLMALGIPVRPLPNQGEIMTRETADPFPGDSRFSTRP